MLTKCLTQLSHFPGSQWLQLITGFLAWLVPSFNFSWGLEPPKAKTILSRGICCWGTPFLGSCLFAGVWLSVALLILDLPKVALMAAVYWVMCMDGPRTSLIQATRPMGIFLPCSVPFCMVEAEPNRSLDMSNVDGPIELVCRRTLLLSCSYKGQV